MIERNISHNAGDGDIFSPFADTPVDRCCDFRLYDRVMCRFVMRL